MGKTFIFQHIIYMADFMKITLSPNSPIGRISKIATPLMITKIERNQRLLHLLLKQKIKI